MTSNYSLETCPFFTSIYFEVGTSTAPYTVNAALNILLAIVGAIANVLVFYAIRKSTSMHLPSKVLLCSLVLSDLGVNLVAQPLFITFLIAKRYESLSGIRCLTIASSSISSSMMAMVSLLTMTALSLDRFIALFFHVEYRGIVTTKRVSLVVVGIWSFATFSASTWIWNTSLLYPFTISVIGLSFVVISFAYSKIYLGLRNNFGHQIQADVQTQQQAGNTLNVAKFRRLASSMLGLYCLFILCYLPYVCAAIVRQFVGYTACMQLIFEFTGTLVYLNSCLNPFVYCLRLPDIRGAVLQTVRALCGLNIQQWRPRLQATEDHTKL